LKKNGLLHDVFCLLFQGYLRKALWGFCAAAVTTISFGGYGVVSCRNMAAKGLVAAEQMSLLIFVELVIL
jgi:hypothetical protein